MTDVAQGAPGDADLVAEPYVLRPGPAEAFETFYAREMPRLITFARALCGAAAEDMAQEAMLVAYRRWPEVSAMGRPEAWVRRVCANLATSTVRRRVVESRALIRLGSRPTAPLQELAGDAEAFWAEVRRLPRRQAQTVALRYVYDLDIAQISATLGCTEGTTKTQLHRARATLRKRLDLAEEQS